ncbi:MAG: HAD hydrolase family protein [Candidatus Cloacimonadales bacterium]|nr:HAD hydrolase family protein [Candidatus Cloacimonadota bacterium]MDD2649657.1 HAD hydrolase family protein [Candidatus Cloacimonadota bacterium]MDD3501170.1 HAD hydrolase family protein [Candidatus Cloacimonadota bacterium]MDX9976938.1 HAD hydrolase family protein [Candidatus Cloacimonadales bacterium]
MNKNIIAIDLHGTLLNKHWQLPKAQQEAFYKSYKRLKDTFDFYICTGNDYSFLTRYLPNKFLTFFKGFILETGALYWEKGEETILIDVDMIEKIKCLEDDLKMADFRFIHYFATRKATISMFTHTEQTGSAPDMYVATIKDFMLSHPLNMFFNITWSNVAIDIIPKGINKYTGIKNVANNVKIISLLDSMNDYDLAINSDVCFLPANSSKKLLDSIKYSSIDKYNKDFINAIYLCKNDYSEGVIEALNKL